MTLADRPGNWERLKSQLAQWLPLFGYLSAQRIGSSCCHLQRGKIQPPYSCEINAVDHCNLACLDCDHAAPALAESYADPAIVHSDLSLLAKHYRSRVVKIIGGEPLLHPDLVELLKAIRRSGVSRRLQLVTNGLLLENMSEQAWKELDIIEVSSYPQTALTALQLRILKEKAVRFRVKLQLWHYDNFSCTFALRGTADRELISRIYRNCRQVNTLGCHSIYQGFLYKCPQAIFIAKIAEGAGLTAQQNGFRLTDSPNFSSDLINYLTSEEPLDACQYCLDNVGKNREHRMISKNGWLAHHNYPTEELIDMGKLVAFEANPCAFEPLRKPLGQANR